MMIHTKKTLNVLVLVIVASSACLAPDAPTPTSIVSPTVSPTTLVAALMVTQDTAGEEKELAVLRQTLEVLCADPHFFPELGGNRANYWMRCWPSTGHSTSAHIQRLEGPAEASAAFYTAVTDHPVQDFHGYPSANWTQPDPNYPGMTYRYWVWQTDRWVVQIESFDDTSFLFALEPGEVAETLYQFAQETLFTGP
jgi:hypothetical protein